MRGAEGVVHIGVVTLDEALGEARVVSRLAGIEAEVLKQFHTGDQLYEPRPNRFHGIRRIRRTAGTPQVGTGRDMGSGIQQVAQGGQRRPDAQVVGDGPAGEGDVEVAADQHPSTVQVAEVLQSGNVHGIGGPARLAALSGLRLLRPSGAHDPRQVHQAGRVAHLVVVPAEDLHHLPSGHGESGVERARGRPTHDVG